MKVELQGEGTLVITPENITEAWALKFWLDHNKVFNYHGSEMIPSRSIIVRTCNSASFGDKQP